MKYSDSVFYRKMYFSFPLKEEPALRGVYASLIKGTKNVLIDCGVSYNYPDIVQLAAEAGLRLSDIDMIMLTHCHSDHSGGLRRLKEEVPTLQVAAHPLGKPMLEDIDAHFKKRPVAAFHYLNGGSVTVDRVLEDNEEIDIGFPVRIIYTPGHSEDSLSVYLPEEKLLLSGDAIPHVHDMPFYDDLPAQRRTLAKLSELPTDAIISGFSGLWVQKEQGDIYGATTRLLDGVQKAVDDFGATRPGASMEEMGRYVLRQIEVTGLPIPIFITSLKEHMKTS